MPTPDEYLAMYAHHLTEWSVTLAQKKSGLHRGPGNDLYHSDPRFKALTDQYRKRTNNKGLSTAKTPSIYDRAMSGELLPIGREQYAKLVK